MIWKKDRKNLKKDPNPMEPAHKILLGAWNNDYDEVDLALLENPNCINDQDENGLTAAHISVGLNGFRILERVANSTGYNPFVTDNFNRRAIDCVNMPGMQNYRKLLMNKMYGVFPNLGRGMRLI